MQGIIYTKEEISFLEKNYSKLSMIVMAEKLGRSKKSIYDKSNRMGFRRFDEAQRAKIENRKINWDKI
jgi:predicted DNA-binding transcriptional regulator AlpA